MPVCHGHADTVKGDLLTVTGSDACCTAPSFVIGERARVCMYALQPAAGHDYASSCCL